MKKNISKPDFTKAFKIFLSFGTLSLAISGITLIGIKNRDKTEYFNVPITHSDQQTEKLLDQINYLSIGDSISAGFNWDYSVDLRGKIDENNKINGLSYPAFFASFIQKIKPNALKSFDNLALSWTTISDWLYLLNPENPVYKHSDKTHFNFNYHLDKKLDSPYGQQIREVFGDFNSNSYPKLYKKIKDSNLLTLSLGANDLMESIDFRTIAKPMQKLASKGEANFEFAQNIEIVNQKIYRNLQLLIQSLRKINPDLQIVLVGYNSLSSKIIKFFEKMLTNEIGVPENYVDLVIKRLNSTIKKAAKSQKVNYVDLYNESIWQAKTSEFSTNDLDIHPSTKGYKKMAQDLLFKLAFQQDLEFKNEANTKLQWDENYVQKDTNYYRRILNLGNNSEIFNALTVDNSPEKFISEDSEIEKLTTQNVKKSTESPIENFINVILNNNFGAFLSRFMQLAVQNNSSVQKILTDFWQENQKSGASFSEILQKIYSSGFFSKIINRFQTYVQDVTNKKDWEKATISGLVNYIFVDFDEKQIIDVLNTVVTSEFADKNPEKIKELIFSSIFGQTIIQDLLINNIIKIDLKNKEDLKVVFTFDSIRKLFSKIITDYHLRSSEYKNAQNFHEIIRTYLENPENDNDNVIFIRNFISETLKHHDSVKLLVSIINDNFEFNLNEADQSAIVNLLVSIADVVVRTNVWAKLNDQAAKNFLGVIKGIKTTDIAENIASIFSEQIYTNYSSFFKDSKNLLDLFHELLSFDLSQNQIDSLKKLLNKFYPVLTKFDITNFIDDSNPNFASFSFFLDSAKDFLSSNSFKPLADIVNQAIDDFLVNKSIYQQIDNLNRFGFQFLANNLPKLEENIYEFIARNVENGEFLTNLSSLISNSLNSQGLNEKSIETFTSIIELIFQDFRDKYLLWKEDNTSPTDNLIFTFVKAALDNFKAFTKENFDEYNSVKLRFEEAEKQQKAVEIARYSHKMASLDETLSFQNFSSYFLNNFFSQDTIYKLLKNLASLNFKTKISDDNLVLFFKNLFGQSFLHKQLLEKLNQNSFFSKPKIQNSLLSILTNFFESKEVEKLLSELIKYFFDEKKFQSHPNFNSLVENFLKENTPLIEEVFRLFLGDSSTWNSISDFLKIILQEYNLKLSEQSVQTILDLVRDIFSKLRDSTLDFNDQTKTHSPLIIKALISIIFDAISGNSTPKKPVLETLFDSLSVDIANNYYSTDQTNTLDNTEKQAKISQNSISTLISEIISSDPISEQIRAGLKNVPQDYLDNILPIFDWFLKSPELKDLFNSYFKIVAKAQIQKPLDNFSLIKTLFEQQYFNKIIGDFIVKLDEKNETLIDNFGKLAGKIFETEFEKTEFQPLFKLVKEIIQNNIDNFYKNESDPKQLFPPEATTVNVSQDFSEGLANTQLFNDTGPNVDQNSTAPTTSSETVLPKSEANYTKENALLTKFISILGKFTSGDFSASDLNLLLESEIAKEEFIVELIKQVASVYNKIEESEKNDLWKVITKIFQSKFFKNKINSLAIGDVSSFSLFSNLSEQKRQEIEPLLKELLLQFLPDSANKVLIFRLLKYINENPKVFKDVKTFSSLLANFLKDESTQNNQSQGQPEVQNNSEFLKSYLWYVVHFLVKNDKFSDLVIDVIASYLKLNLDDNKDYSSKIEKPREILKKFLTEFIGLGLENPLISGILDQIVDSIKNSDTSQQAKSFFETLFSKLDLSKVLNLDLVVKIEPKIDDSTQQTSQTETQNLIDETNLSIKTPTGQKISTQLFAEFFDTLFLTSPKWDSTNKDNNSPILNELNNIEYTGISLKEVFGSSSNKGSGGKGGSGVNNGSGGKDSQLDAISKLFHKIWYSEKTKSKISIDNFKDSAKGRFLYRLVLILLFYTYESRISQANYIIQSSAFYGGLLSSYTASEVIRASLQSGEQSDKNNTKDDEYKTFIDKIIGNPVKSSGWWTTWYKSYDVKLNDMLTMIYYNLDANRFFHDTGQPKLRDQIFQQIHDGTYPDNYENPTTKR
ncbi:SGNH/GDSL hydrolase family protein [Mesomycoplasma ovipneumoniae]|uniref:SGNH/GDSL hydrolase family protein n=1 Tax=Mesomycoplasma ovipneumoniae TaxID=29562 RepID=UPI0029651502|nr:SGNH/GDSL hydrolase family protein [Mesomycoplasma ovipneumoniae]MDW2926886.1 SGNH/GDSL hydrolase family protein [Mesomycoplasma ovipneumoniae]MDW2929903.1 SGNH/GDSL hydrolase family protein [Mesomycoplasma ovipneumoniae]